MTAAAGAAPFTPPARGTRPRNRRALIVAAAGELFYRKGYSQVGMADIADAVAISRPALYRHFAGKQELLAEVVRTAIATTSGILDADDQGSQAELFRTLARAALDHRAGAILWQRDGRHLPDEQRAQLRTETRQFGSRICQLITSRRPGLGEAEADFLSWSALGVAMSVSFHQNELPRPAYDDMLTGLITAVVRADVTLAGEWERRAPTEGLASTSRWEALLNTAIRLFARRGYASVGMDEIAAEVGIAGPSVYNHFASKSDILVAAMLRGFEWIRLDTTRALAAARDPRDGLTVLLRSYADFTMENNHLIDLLITEIDELPPTARAHARRAQRDYIDDWVHLVRAVHPGLDATRGRIQVIAALSMLNDIARTPHLRELPGVADAACTVGAAVLDLPSNEGSG